MKKENGFTTETINKFAREAKARISEYSEMVKTGQSVSLSISKGNRKIGHVMNVSIMPIFTCPNCSECKKFCYDIRDIYTRGYNGNVMHARARNTAVWICAPETFFSEIRKALSHRRKNKFFRWHVGGEIPNYDYFCEMVNIAKDFPDFIFWTYTKNYAVVNQYVKEHGNNRDAIPGNLSIMFSVWNGMPCVNSYGFGTFQCVMPGFPAIGEWKCPGNCETCIKAGRGCPVNESAYVDLH